MTHGATRARLTLMRLLGAILLLAVGCGNQTVCASEDALAMDSRMPEIIELAVSYWDDRGWRGVTAVDGHICDVPVTVDTTVPRYAETDVTEPIHDRTACSGERVRINPERWGALVELGTEVRVMAHEVGHVHCLEDIQAGNGVMSYRAHVDGFADYQLTPDATVQDPHLETQPQ